MPIHPAPPQDLPGRVEAYRQCVQAVVDLGRGLSDEQLALPTDCPGWSVHDQLAHVAAVEAHLDGSPAPDVEVAGDHIRSEHGRLMERGVVARRGRTRDQLVSELDYLLERRLAYLGSPGMEPDSLVPALEGAAPVEELLRLRTVDVWTHEQDIREAVGRPGDLDSAAAAVFVATAFTVVPRAAAKGGLPVGDTLIIELTGPVIGRIGVKVEDEDGRRRGVALFGTAAADEQTGLQTGVLRAIDPDATVTSVKLSTGAFARIAAGRRKVDEVGLTVTGDEQTARAVLAALPFTP